MTTAEAYSVRHLTVDSRDRDADHFPSPSSFEVSLEEPIRDVTSISLRSWSVPPVLPVAQGYHSIWITDSSGNTVRVDSPFDYRSGADEASFLAALSDAATSAASNQAISVSSADGVVTLSSQSKFSVFSGDPSVAVWAPGNQSPDPPRFTSLRLGDGYGPASVARALGLPRGETEAAPNGAGGFSIRAPHRHSLNTPVTSYIRVSEAPGYSVPSTGLPTGAAGCLGIVRHDDRGGSGGTQPGASLVEKSYHPPLSKLSKVSASVVDYFGRELVTDNREVRLDFVVRTAPSNSASEAGFSINNATASKQYDEGRERTQMPAPLHHGMFSPLAFGESSTAPLRAMQASEAALFVLPRGMTGGG